ncbi:MAG: DUF4377 domain-containing protein [Chitinophagales bacterium]
MNNQLIFIVLLFVFGAVGCTATKNTTNKKETTMDANKNTTSKEGEYIYWVNSRRVDCVGEGPQKCLQVQKGEIMADANWEFFYSRIEGFNYEEGNIYKLIVKETTKPQNQVPAGGSSIRYELVKVIDKQVDAKLRLYDIWALESIDGQEIDIKTLRKHPSIEINLTTMRVMGNDGCNSLMGDIKSVGAKNLVFGALAGTKMACPNMELSSRFNQRLAEVQYYQLKGLKLYLLDGASNELLRFRKVD